jgi:hypothetical protein
MPKMCYMCLDGLRRKGPDVTVDDFKLAGLDPHGDSLSDYAPGDLCEYHRREAERPGRGVENGFMSARSRTGFTRSRTGFRGP